MTTVHVSPGERGRFGGAQRLIKTSICSLRLLQQQLYAVVLTQGEIVSLTTSVAVVTNEFLMPHAVNSWIKTIINTSDHQNFLLQ